MSLTRDEQSAIVIRQMNEIISCAKFTCVCKKVVRIILAYRCLYCGVWMCQRCMEKHLGMSRVDYNKKHYAKDMVK